MTKGGTRDFALLIDSVTCAAIALSPSLQEPQSPNSSPGPSNWRRRSPLSNKPRGFFPAASPASAACDLSLSPRRVGSGRSTWRGNPPAPNCWRDERRCESRTPASSIAACYLSSSLRSLSIPARPQQHQPMAEAPGWNNQRRSVASHGGTSASCHLGTARPDCTLTACWSVSISGWPRRRRYRCP